MPNNGAGGDEEIQALRLVVARLEHELRSPLQAVVGFARLLRDRVPEDARDLVNKVCAGADQLTELVDEMALEWVAGTPRARGEDTVRDAVTRTLALAQLLAQERRVALRVEGSGTDVVVPASLGVTRLTQVLTNLMTNAVKFAPSGSVVSLAVQQVGDQWTFVVEDDGPGVTPGDESRIFEPFVRSTTRPGAGLGLYVVRTLVETAGGTVRVERVSKEGGARFTVVVPAAAT